MSEVEDVTGRPGSVLNQSPGDLCEVADHLGEVVTSLATVAEGWPTTWARSGLITAPARPPEAATATAPPITRLTRVGLILVYPILPGLHGVSNKGEIGANTQDRLGSPGKPH